MPGRAWSRLQILSFYDTCSTPREFFHHMPTLHSFRLQLSKLQMVSCCRTLRLPYQPEQYYTEALLCVYVMRKVWICAIHGLSCAKYRSILCATKYGFVAHSMDCPAVMRKVWICAKYGFAQSMDCPAQSS